MESFSPVVKALQDDVSFNAHALDGWLAEKLTWFNHTNTKTEGATGTKSKVNCTKCRQAANLIDNSNML